MKKNLKRKIYLIIKINKYINKKSIIYNLKLDILYILKYIKIYIK